MKRNKICFSVFLLVAFFIGISFVPSNIRADSNKKITITFVTNPTIATANVAQLKYNKNFAFSYSFDDGLIAGYDTAFKYMNGGYSSYLGQSFGGLYFTDGAGNNVPFRGGYAFYNRNSNYSDIHINTPSYINWTQLQDATDYGWDIFNHGYTSASIPENDPNHIYYIGDPGGHAQGPLDYAYELNKMATEVASHINLKNNAGSTTIPFPVTQVILPNGDANYIQPAFDNNFKAVYAQRADYVFDGSTVTSPEYVNVNNPISNNRHVMKRWFDYETRYLAGGEYPGGLLNRVNELASISTGTNKYWSQEFTHQITTSTYSGDWNGGITWNTWKSLMDHIENTYGRFGNDKAWVAGAEEVYDYMMVKQNINLTQTLVGNQLTIELDTTNVPTNLRHSSLSLLINSDAQISSITYGTDFTYHSDNKNTGLVNVDWGVNSYSKNDITRVEGLVTAAESAKSLSSINNARTYVNLLSDTQQSAEKASFISRLDAIVVPLRTWYVNVKGVTSLCSNATTTKSFPPSPYNWNHYYVGASSATVCSDLLNLKDSDGQVSTISLSNTAPFKSGSLQALSTGNNSGLYPDAVLIDNAQIYASPSVTAKIKIYGLENIKTYNIKLFGYTSATGKTGDSAKTEYIIGGVTKELYVRENLINYVDFLNVVPINGEIELSIQPKSLINYGYGVLTAMEIKENVLDAPSAFSYTSPNVYTKNSSITSLVPTVTGLGITYSISPSLPTGLSLDTSTGVISGTPTVISPTSYYTITATNGGGSINFPVSITVNDIAPNSLSYTSSNIYTKNSSITSLVPSSSGGSVLSYSISPSLPTGLSLDTSTGIISGTPTVSASQNTYTVTATNTGGSTTFQISITVNESAPTSLSYTTPNIFAKNSVITPLSPTINGNGLTYSISPSLPTGLSLDTSTGIISGTPTVFSSLTAYTVTATNTGGSTTFQISITVNESAPTSLSYTTPNIFVKNSSITSLSPTTDGLALTYSIAPDLPNGLSIDSTTGVISGTPTVVTGVYTYTVIATNTGGETTFGVVITVNDIAPNNLSYTTPNTFTKDTGINSLSPNVSGGAVVGYSISPSLPTGLSLDTSTGIISGTPTVSASQNTYTVTATNTGGSTTFQISITVNDPNEILNELTSIFIFNLPTKTNYNVDELLDIDGLVVKGNYEDQSTQVLNITKDNISGFNSTTTGNKILTITYEGKTTTYLINITRPSTISSSGSMVSNNFLNFNKKNVSLVEKTNNFDGLITKVVGPFVFTKNLQIGSRNKEVLELQKYLNNHGFIIIQKGNGSPGHEINYFGKATKEALGKFQLENGIIIKKMSKSYGVFGPATRRFVNNHK